MAQANYRQRCSDGSASSAFNGSHQRAGIHHRRFSPTNAFAARRLFVCLASEHSSFDSFGSSPLPKTSAVLVACRISAIKSSLRKSLRWYPIGYFHIDIAEVCTEQGRLYLFVAIDRTSKFTYAELHPDQTRDRACQFLHQLINVVPYHIHTILTDNGIQFTNRLKDKWAFLHLSRRYLQSTQNRTPAD